MQNTVYISTSRKLYKKYYETNVKLCKYLCLVISEYFRGRGTTGVSIKFANICHPVLYIIHQYSLDREKNNWKRGIK